MRKKSNIDLKKPAWMYGSQSICPKLLKILTYACNYHKFCKDLPSPCKHYHFLLFVLKTWKNKIEKSKIGAERGRWQENQNTSLCVCPETPLMLKTELPLVWTATAEYIEKKTVWKKMKWLSTRWPGQEGTGLAKAKMPNVMFSA